MLTEQLIYGILKIWPIKLTQNTICFFRLNISDELLMNSIITLFRYQHNSKSIDKS